MTAAAAAACYSFILAGASWLFEQDNASSVPAAVRLVPYNSTYLWRLASWRPDQRVALLQRAIELNPFDFHSLIQLGIDSEFQKHDNARAERYYLKAFDVNKMFLPKWTLTNFYFRHERRTDFFRWATATLAITPYAPEPVFTQMWLLSARPTEIARAIPDRPRILLPYAWFLSNSHQDDAIPPIVSRLVAAVGKGDPHAWGRDDLLPQIEDRLVTEGERGPALAIWGSMVKAGWLHGGVPSNADPVTNGQFRTPFYHHGFDWVPANVDGVRVEQSPVEGLVRLQFSGDEPESCTLLQQYIPLEAGREYTFGWRVESRLIDMPSGLTWRLKPVPDGERAGFSSGDLSITQREGWRFRAPLQSNLYLLSLEYRRPLGHLRATGTVTLRSVWSTEK